ncbi:MAG: helix-turn-helix domain-containing protein [Rhodobacteraceae bacterium]|nr:helix-turn-helix domain-containing protein [Paracoccaceae bacterium]
MVKALSLDLRVRVLKAVSEGASHHTVAERFGISAASISRWRALAQTKGEPRPRAAGRGSTLGSRRGVGRADQGAAGGDAGHHHRGVARGAGRARPWLRPGQAAAVLPPSWPDAQKRPGTRPSRTALTS